MCNACMICAGHCCSVCVRRWGGVRRWAVCCVLRSKSNAQRLPEDEIGVVPLEGKTPVCHKTQWLPCHGASANAA